MPAPTYQGGPPRAPADVSLTRQTRPPVSDLLARADAGDQTAWNDLVDRYTSLLWSVARAHRLSNADAADVVQTTWLRLVENLGRIQDPECLPGWLVTTARRESLATIRRSGRETPVDADLVVDGGDPHAEPVDAPLLGRERDDALWRCLGLLPEKCQRLLRVLMAAEPPAYAQVSEALGLPVGSIGPTRMRCLDRLRAIVRDAGYAFDTGVPAARSAR